MSVIVDTYNESNADGGRIVAAGFKTGGGQSFVASGNFILTQAKFYLSKSGSPTGNATANLYAHSGTLGTSSVPTGTALATSQNFDVSTLTGSLALITLTFNTPYRLVSGTSYVITFEYGGGDISNNISFQQDSTSPTHQGNQCTLDTGVWAATSTIDSIFYVYGDAFHDLSLNINKLRPRVFAPGNAR